MSNLDNGSSIIGLRISALFLARVLTLLGYKSDPTSSFNLEDFPFHSQQNPVSDKIYEALHNLLAIPNSLPLLCSLGSGHMCLLTILKQQSESTMGSLSLRFPLSSMLFSETWTSPASLFFSDLGSKFTF